jgi:hypothetical protein
MLSGEGYIHQYKNWLENLRVGDLVSTGDSNGSYHNVYLSEIVSIDDEFIYIGYEGRAEMPMLRTESEKQEQAARKTRHSRYRRTDGFWVPDDDSNAKVAVRMVNEGQCLLEPRLGYWMQDQRQRCFDLVNELACEHEETMERCDMDGNDLSIPWRLSDDTVLELTRALFMAVSELAQLPRASDVDLSPVQDDLTAMCPDSFPDGWDTPKSHKDQQITELRQEVLRLKDILAKQGRGNGSESSISTGIHAKGETDGPLDA